MAHDYLHADTVKRSFSLHQQLSRLSLSILCVVLFLASFKKSQDQGNLTPTQVNTFNAISGSLGLLLSLSFFDAFKDLAKVSRAIIWARKPWSDAEKRLIEDAASLVAVTKLGFSSRSKRPWVLWACLLCIAFNLAAQTAVVLISQTFNVQDGTDWNGTYVRPGQVNAVDLSCFHHHLHGSREYRCDPSPENVQGIVHAYGQSTFGSLSYGQDCEKYTTMNDILLSRKNPKYFCRRTPGQQEFAYRFLEYNPHDDQRIYPFLTNRVITVSAGSCYDYFLSSVNEGSDAGGTWSNYTYSNGTVNGSIVLPVQTDSLHGTAYTYRGFQTPQDATVQACGDRCIWVWAYKTALGSEQSTFYQCPVTVNPVQSYGETETPQDAHKVSNDMARLAASSIALQGGNSDPDNGWSQSQLYPYANSWDIHNKPIDEVGANMAEFALGSIAAKASNNPPTRIPGQLPTLGSRLKVQWGFAISLLVVIAVVHSALSGLAFYMNYRNHVYLIKGSGNDV